MPDEWLTIAQAAERLGLAERQARRYAARLPDSDRTIDRTPAGRERALVSLSALSAIVKDARRTGQTPDSGLDTDRTEEAASVPLALALTSQRDALERVISAQAAQIAELQATVEHERQTSRRWQEALGREQMLRALPPPAPDVAAPDAPEPGPATAAPAHDPAQESAATSFWERIGLTRRKPMQGSSEDGVK